MSNREMIRMTRRAMKLGSNLDEILTNLEFMDWATINQNRTQWVEQFDQIVQA